MEAVLVLAEHDGDVHGIAVPERVDHALLDQAVDCRPGLLVDVAPRVGEIDGDPHPRHLLEIPRDPEKHGEVEAPRDVRLPEAIERLAGFPEALGHALSGHREELPEPVLLRRREHEGGLEHHLLVREGVADDVVDFARYAVSFLARIFLLGEGQGVLEGSVDAGYPVYGRIEPGQLLEGPLPRLRDLLEPHAEDVGEAEDGCGDDGLGGGRAGPRPSPEDRGPPDEEGRNNDEGAREEIVGPFKGRGHGGHEGHAEDKPQAGGEGEGVAKEKVAEDRGDEGALGSRGAAPEYGEGGGRERKADEGVGLRNPPGGKAEASRARAIEEERGAMADG